MAVDGKAVALALAGGVLVWTGLTSPSGNPRDVLASALSGKRPALPSSSPAISPGSGGGAPAPGSPGPGHPSANRAMGQLMAAAYGWTGDQWTALDNLWERESGWDNLAFNPSGAFGIAQALGHGTAAVAVTVAVHNSGTGTTTTEQVDAYPSRAANSGQAAAQISWGLGDIRSVYGSPAAAWAHEQSHGWY